MASDPRRIQRGNRPRGKIVVAKPGDIRGQVNLANLVASLDYQYRVAYEHGKYFAVVVEMTTMQVVGVTVPKFEQRDGEGSVGEYIKLLSRENGMKYDLGKTTRWE